MKRDSALGDFFFLFPGTSCKGGSCRSERRSAENFDIRLGILGSSIRSAGTCIGIYVCVYVQKCLVYHFLVYVYVC